MTINMARTWGALVILSAVAYGAGCELLVQVDQNQVPLPIIRDSSVAGDSSDAAQDASSDRAADAGIDLSDSDSASVDAQPDSD
jgi:hypothetical protein